MATETTAETEKAGKASKARAPPWTRKGAAAPLTPFLKKPKLLSTTTLAPPVAPVTPGWYIISAYAGGRVKLPGMLARSRSRTTQCLAAGSETRNTASSPNEE